MKSKIALFFGAGLVGAGLVVAIADWQKTASLYLAEGKTKDCHDALDKIKQIQP